MHTGMRPHPPTMKAPPGTPYDCDAPGYSGGKPKMVWGSMVDGESPAGWTPWALENFGKKS